MRDGILGRIDLSFCHSLPVQGRPHGPADTDIHYPCGCRQYSHRWDISTYAMGYGEFRRTWMLSPVAFARRSTTKRRADRALQRPVSALPVAARGRGGIGRRKGLKIPRSSIVRVRSPPSAPAASASDEHRALRWPGRASHLETFPPDRPRMATRRVKRLY